MNLTNIMLFGGAVIGDGGGGGTSGGKLVLHKRFESIAEMQAQPFIPITGNKTNFNLYKFFDETPTYAEVNGGVMFTSQTVADVMAMKIPLDELSDMGFAWAFATEDGTGGELVARVMCLNEEGANEMGFESGIYISEELFSGGVEAYIIGA